MLSMKSTKKSRKRKHIGTKIKEMSIGWARESQNGGKAGTKVSSKDPITHTSQKDMAKVMEENRLKEKVKVNVTTAESQDIGRESVRNPRSSNTRATTVDRKVIRQQIVSHPKETAKEKASTR